MAIANVFQHIAGGGNPTTRGQSGNNYKLPLLNASGAGNCLVLGITNDGGATITSISDNINGTWGAAAVTALAGSGNLDSRIYVLPNIAAGQITITVTYSAAVTMFSYVVTELYGIATSSPSAGTTSAVNSTTQAAGSFTPTNNDSTGGNLIWAYFAKSAQIPASSTTHISAGTSFTLLSADTGWNNANDSAPKLVEAYVQTTSAAVNPGFTSTSDTSDPWNSLAIALRISTTSGTAPSSGIQIRSMQHFATLHFPGSGAYTLQCPSFGNLRCIMSDDPSLNALTVTDSEGGTWTAGATGAGFWYRANTSENANLVVTITGGGGDVTLSWRFADIFGAATSPFDSSVANGQNVNGLTSFTASPSPSPTNTNGLVIANIGLGQGPGLAVTAPSGAVWDLCTYTGEFDTDLIENADITAHYNNTSSGAETWTFSITSQPSNSTSGGFIAFQAAPLAPPVSGSTLQRLGWGQISPYYINEVSGAAHLVASAAYVNEYLAVVYASATIPAVAAVSPMAGRLALGRATSSAIAAVAPAASQILRAVSTPAPVSTVSTTPNLFASPSPVIPGEFLVAGLPYQLSSVHPSVSASASVVPTDSAVRGLIATLGLVYDSVTVVTGPASTLYTPFQRLAPITWAYLNEVNNLQYLGTGSYIDGAAQTSTIWFGVATLATISTVRPTARLVEAIRPTLPLVANVNATASVLLSTAPRISTLVTVAADATDLVSQLTTNYFQRLSMGGAFEPVYINEVFNKQALSTGFAYIDQNVQRAVLLSNTINTTFGERFVANLIVSISWIGGNPSIWDGGSTTWDGGASTWDGSLASTVTTNAVIQHTITNEIDVQFTAPVPSPFLIERAFPAPIAGAFNVAANFGIPGLSESHPTPEAFLDGTAVYSVLDSRRLPVIPEAFTQNVAASLLTTQRVNIVTVGGISNQPFSVLDMAVDDLAANVTVSSDAPAIRPITLEIDAEGFQQASTVALYALVPEIDGEAFIAVDATRLGFNDAGLVTIDTEGFAQLSENTVLSPQVLPIAAVSNVTSDSQVIRGARVAVLPLTGAITTIFQGINYIPGSVEIDGSANLYIRTTTSTLMNFNGEFSVGVNATIIPRIADSGLVLPLIVDGVIVPVGEVIDVQ